MDFKLIDIEKLKTRKDELSKQWNDPAKPFRYLVSEEFFKPEVLPDILNEYPDIFKDGWDNTTYINQKNKFTMTTFGEDKPVLQQVFSELNSQAFLKVMEDITGIEGLVGDPQLFGGGLHQSINGAFLDVHVDFNLHPTTRQHRRMNLLVYMNDNWKEENNGYLELWDMKSKKQVANVAPTLNRWVVFETSEISFHGHPKKLNTPDGVSRKSIAVYYYTNDRPVEEIADEHNTIYVNTEGGAGILKNLQSGIKALWERIVR